jgi:hypothetical protein
LGDLYTGENRAHGYEDEAAAARYSGAAAEYGAKRSAKGTRIKSYFEAGATILKAAGAYAGADSSSGGAMRDRLNPEIPDEGQPLRINRYGGPSLSRSRRGLGELY